MVSRRKIMNSQNIKNQHYSHAKPPTEEAP